MFSPAFFSAFSSGAPLECMRGMGRVSIKRWQSRDSILAEGPTTICFRSVWSFFSFPLSFLMTSLSQSDVIVLFTERGLMSRKEPFWLQPFDPEAGLSPYNIERRCSDPPAKSFCPHSSQFVLAPLLRVQTGVRSRPILLFSPPSAYALRFFFGFGLQIWRCSYGFDLVTSLSYVLFPVIADRTTFTSGFLLPRCSAVSLEHDAHQVHTASPFLWCSFRFFSIG